MTQKHQRGSVIGFVVVGVLLAIAVVGGIYVVKNQLNGNMPGPSNDEVAQIVDESADDTSDTADEATDESTENTDESTQGEGDTTDETAAPVEESDDQAAPSDDESTAVEEAPADTTEDEAMPQTGVETPAETADELPQTGAGENLYALIALGALVGSVVAYRRSFHL